MCFIVIKFTRQCIISHSIIIIIDVNNIELKASL